ncbi:MAG: hypothetical protein CM15mV127_050 [Caudoviricetes sp.]|nr:MAG: hypothetical protein CM15mV127_050 [Caudoviricetes sp.]
MNIKNHRKRIRGVQRLKRVFGPKKIPPEKFGKPKTILGPKPQVRLLEGNLCMQNWAGSLIYIQEPTLETPKYS